MNRQKLISDLANDTYLKQYASVLCKSDIANDIWQEALLHVCELDDETFNKYSNNLKKYIITQMYLLNLHRIGKKKKALTNLCDSSIQVDRLQMIDDSYNYEIDETFNKVINIIESNVKESDMIIFFETINNNMRTIERELNIPYVTIRSKRKRVIDKIKELIK
jgi:hypothetical protein